MKPERKKLVKEMSDLRNQKTLLKFWTRRPKFYRGRHFPNSWGTTAISKFSERVILAVSGGEETRKAIPEVRQALNDALWFTSSTILIDYETGLIRVSDPTRSWAEVDSWGRVTYIEELKGTTDRLIGRDGTLFYESPGFEDEELNAGCVTIFWKVDSEHPCGLPKIMPADFALIVEKSYSLARRSVWADQAALPKPLINGLWEDADPEIGSAVADLAAGTNSAAGLPKDPDTGEKLEITAIPAAPGSPLFEHESQLARDFAASQKITPYELGEKDAQPPSPEAMASIKESLILEVRAWEDEILPTLTKFFQVVAILHGEEEPKVGFENPAQISESTRMAAAVQAQSIWPQYRYSEAAAREAGLSDAVVREIFEAPEVVVPDAAETLF